MTITSDNDSTSYFKTPALAKEAMSREKEFANLGDKTIKEFLDFAKELYWDGDATEKFEKRVKEINTK